MGAAVEQRRIRDFQNVQMINIGCLLRVLAQFHFELSKCFDVVWSAVQSFWYIYFGFSLDLDPQDARRSSSFYVPRPSSDVAHMSVYGCNSR